LLDVGVGVDAAGAIEIDAKGKLVLPGGEIAADGRDGAVLDADIGVELVDGRADAAGADDAIERGLWHLAPLSGWHSGFALDGARPPRNNGAKSRRTPAWLRARAAASWW
jgi:hypothetical protein